MLRAYISERLLAFLTTRERAAAIVGDLLELHSRPAEFWLAATRTLWALSWRFALGFLLAAPAEFYLFFGLIHWAAALPHGIDPQATRSGMCCALFTAGALFSLVRFGGSNTITRLSTVLALLTGLDLLFWWVPFIRPASEAMAVLLVLLFCLARRGRLALRRLMVATVAASVPLVTMLYLITKATPERCRYGCNLDVHNFPILNIVPIAFLLSSAIVAGVLGRHQEDWAQLV